MRGKDVDALGSVCRLGITPAYAGKRDGDDAVLACFWDHPRVCGEKGLLSYKIDQTQGSPPRMRGKEYRVKRCSSDNGITPAYAGKSLPKRSEHHETRDHPRVCGEKAQGHKGLFCVTGSPPRMRGKAVDKKKLPLVDRITPAYAGKRLLTLSTAWAGKDHPRVCGEKYVDLVSAASQIGSPPRMRGKAFDSGKLIPFFGITPAYAGKRLKRSHSIGHFSCILRLFHSVLHRASASGGSRAGPCAPPCLPAQNAVPV